MYSREHSLFWHPFGITVVHPPPEVVLFFRMVSAFSLSGPAPALTEPKETKGDLPALKVRFLVRKYRQSQSLSLEVRFVAIRSLLAHAILLLGARWLEDFLNQ